MTAPRYTLTGPCYDPAVQQWFVAATGRCFPCRQGTRQRTFLLDQANRRAVLASITCVPLLYLAGLARLDWTNERMAWEQSEEELWPSHGGGIALGRKAGAGLKASSANTRSTVVSTILARPSNWDPQASDGSTAAPGALPLSRGATAANGGRTSHALRDPDASSQRRPSAGETKPSTPGPAVPSAAEQWSTEERWSTHIGVSVGEYPTDTPIRARPSQVAADGDGAQAQRRQDVYDLDRARSGAYMVR